MPSPCRRLAALVIAWGTVVFCVLTPAIACDVPVFRYALERWKPDVYELLVVHSGSLTADQLSALDQLSELAVRPESDDEPAAAEKPRGVSINVSVRLVDTSKAIDKATREILDEAKIELAPGKPLVPVLVLDYPHGAKHQGVAWSGPLTKGNADAILDSPARKEIARRLLAGDSSVWVFLATGDEKADNAAMDHLSALLKARERKWLPTTPVRGATDEESAALNIRHSIVRVEAGDEKEAVLRDTLLHSEEEIAGLAGAKAFPVFGQGRALYALVGRGMTERNIDEALAFLTGACSCEIKAQNPGVDLLMAADWSNPSGLRYAEDAAPQLTSLATLAQSAETSDPAAPLPAVSASSPTTRPAAATQPKTPPADVSYGTPAYVWTVVALVVVATIAILAVSLRITRNRGGAQA